MKATNSKWLYLKIGLYGIFLYSVVTIMQYVKSASFSNNVEVLMGSPSQARTLNWCSNSVQAVFIVPGEITIRDGNTIWELCHLSYSSYKAEEVANLKWGPLMKSLSSDGEETVLDADQSLGFLKQGSMIYRADGLKSKLKRAGVPTTD